ncbi:MAG: DUF4340 domain-containing protein [Proteobacteria bacterium]|nr:DUF4340 domain-containing protein [Pseudomonadota bacterium]
MKTYTSSIALVLVLAFIGIYLYFVEYSSYKEKKIKNSFFAGEVDELSMTDKVLNKTTVLINKDGVWTINGKNSEDPKTINTIIHTLKGKPEKTISPSAKESELKDFGLDIPVMVINIIGHAPKDTSKKVTETVYIGSKAPIGFGRYMWLKNKNTIVISSEIYDSFNREVK